MTPPPTFFLLLLLLSALLHLASATCVPRKQIFLFPTPPPPPPPPPPTGSPVPIAGEIDSTSKSVCHRTMYPEVCENTVRVFLGEFGGDGDEAAQIRNILKMHLKLGKKQTVAARTEFEVLVADADKSGAYGAALDICKLRYRESVDGFDKALQALEKGDLPTVQINLDAVLQGFGECGSGDAPGDPTFTDGPWEAHNEDLTKLTDICFDLARLLK